MNKIYGATERQDGLYKIGRNKWELIYGFGKDSEDEEVGYNYRERFDYKPAADEIKAVVQGSDGYSVARRMGNYLFVL